MLLAVFAEQRGAGRFRKRFPGNEFKIRDTDCWLNRGVICYQHNFSSAYVSLCFDVYGSGSVEQEQQFSVLFHCGRVAAMVFFS